LKIVISDEYNKDVKHDKDNKEYTENDNMKSGNKKINIANSKINSNTKNNKNNSLYNYYDSDLKSMAQQTEEDESNDAKDKIYNSEF